MSTNLTQAAPHTSWLLELEAEVLAHPTLHHPLLERLNAGPDAATWKAFGSQHHALVGSFTTHMELLLLTAPNSTQKLWLAKVLVDEYGEGSEGHDHAVLYRNWMSNLDVTAAELDATPIAQEVWDFIGTHLTLARDEPFVAGLGALGPGHEWAIPSLFDRIIPGLAKSGFSEAQRRYFDLHTVQDVEHGRWMGEALALLSDSDAARAEIRRGAMTSLLARGRVWDAILERIESPNATFESPGKLRDLRAQISWFVRGRPWPLRHLG